MSLDLSNLRELRSAIRHEGGVSRRLFLTYAATLAAVPALADRTLAAPRRISFKADPFTLGVASGDPDATSVVLWTKLAPEPLSPDGGMPNEPVSVHWELAEDDAFKTVVQSGDVMAAPLLGHSVHVEVANLKPDRWYWYRFKSGDAQSPVGRTRTLPEAGAMPEKMRFAFASCQHYETGLYTAYDYMAKDELDLVFHLGDYIYEGPGRDNQVRKHAAPKLMTIADYRVRHSQYRSDAFLHKMHALCPWFVTWDDHEVENNYAAEVSERKAVQSPEFLLQRAAAYQAYYEMMPLRRVSIPRGPDMQLYRKASFGKLAEFMVLDTRQYRSDQPNGDKRSDLNAAALDSKQTLMGASQKKWLKDSLTSSHATWNVLAQQVMMGMVDTAPGEEHGYSMDQWPGYAHERIEMGKFFQDKKIKNPVVLTGDIHSNWVNNLRVDDRQADKPIIATEFVGTSITSGGNGTEQEVATLKAENPCVQFHNRQRGYVRCTLTAKDWRSDYIVVPDVSVPGGVSVNKASFIVEAGKPGAKLA
jgi:alkaline phosphatase D